MSPRYLRIFALLVIAFPVSSYSQSLGDVARQVRAERQKSGDVQPRVITNEDIESSAPLNPPEEKATPDGKSDGTQDTATVEDVAPAKKASKESKRLEDQEREMDKRTDEINKQYLDRIAGIREQIQKAQQNLARLQRDQLESTNNFQRNVGTFPSIPEYQQQQRVFTEQIDATRDSITTLNSQLEDAKEAARHAGVPHATDY